MQSGLRITGVILSAVLLCAAAGAQPYPVKPVRVVIPHGPGGTNDIAGRIVFQKMSEQMGQQFLVENRVGAGSVIGETHFATLPPDGYAVMVHSTTLVSNAVMNRNLPYDSRKVFVGVTPLAAQIGIVGVHPLLPARSIKELVNLARTRPGAVAYASAGNGSYTHMAMAYFNSLAGTQMLHVPFKGGGAAAIGLASGEAQVYVASYATYRPFIDRRQVRLLGVVSSERLKSLPELPTVAEAGVPGYDFSSWVGVFVPAGTPRPVIDTLHTAIGKALDSPEVQKRFESLVLEPLYSTPDQFARRLQADYAKYEKISKLLGPVAVN
jgi:tripartite-type tricarboxylate transporter receptor subunit TctC